MEVVWGSNAKSTKKAVKFMLEQMGGTQFRIYTLSPNVPKQKPGDVERSEEELDRGFEYIRLHGGA